MVLTTDSKLIVGAALEGVNEFLWTSDVPVADVSGQMEFVISPVERGSEILVGENARTSRIDLGMPWPPEARIDPDEPLQRIPVPLLWRSLVQDRTGNAEWVTATNSRKHADMLAVHILDRLSDYDDASEYLIAIPDQLSDFSQQKLLDAFSRKGKRNVGFIWNPIALALSWLEELGDTLTLNRDNKDYVLVLHLGAGGLDCTKFLLREKKFNGKTYVCPVRSGGGEHLNVDVLDLVNMRIQDVLESIDSISGSDNLDASWFCLGIPEVWDTKSRHKGVDSKLFNLAGSWQLLPTNSLQGSTSIDSRLRTDLPVHALLDSIYATSRDDLEGASWDELIDRLLRGQLSDLEGNLRGVIVGGLPFAQEGNEWSEYVSKQLSNQMGGSVVTSPTLDAIWNTAEVNRAIATGAGVYGDRRQSGLPTYFDVLPYLGVHAQEEDPDDDGVDESFVPLIPDGSEAEGGKPYIPQPIKNQFALAQGQNELEAILELEDQGRRTLRKTTFRFPHGPDRLMPLEVHVQVQTAGGLPTVEIIPEDSEFLGGTQVYLDWKSMEEIGREELPKRALGWPPIRVPHIAVERASSHRGYGALQAVIDDLLETDYSDRSYPKKLLAFQSRISGNISADYGGIPYRIVDVNGKSPNPDTERLVKRLSRRLDQDFKKTCELSEDINPTNFRLRERKRKLEKRKQKLITVSTYLFGATPPSIREYLVYSHDRIGKYPYQYVHPSARAASNPKEISGFFESMSKSAEGHEEGRWFKVYWLFAAKRILISRSDAHAYLDRDIVNDIYEGLIQDFVPWVEEGGFGIGPTLQLLFYFLRFRRSHKTFLSKDGDSIDKYLHSELKKIIEQARQYVDQRGYQWYGGRRKRMLEVLVGLEEFIDYKGSSNTLIKLREFDEDEGVR